MSIGWTDSGRQPQEEYDGREHVDEVSTQMNPEKSFAVNPSWRVLFADLGIDSASVLRRAQLPEDLFSGRASSLTPGDYFALWTALEDDADDPILPIHIARSFSMEVFDPPIFAAACSPNLNIAAQRLATYKKLIGPMRLDVAISERETVLRYVWPGDVNPPRLLAVTELLFWVALVRLATRSEIRPLRVALPDPPSELDAYRDYLGVTLDQGPDQQVVFAATDADRPFLTANVAMWEFFEPQLRQQLSDMENDATMADRVRAALMELLPSGRATMDSVAYKLAVSPRTLQRKLREENLTFQTLRNEVREALARHYLTNSSMTSAEISFLLGFGDPNSFYRAFHSWTGQTPEAARSLAPRYIE